MDLISLAGQGIPELAENLALLGPGDYLDVHGPVPLHDFDLAIDPRIGARENADRRLAIVDKARVVVPDVTEEPKERVDRQGFALDLR